MVVWSFVRDTFPYSRKGECLMAKVQNVASCRVPFTKVGCVPRLNERDDYLTDRANMDMVDRIYQSNGWSGRHAVEVWGKDSPHTTPEQFAQDVRDFLLYQEQEWQRIKDDTSPGAAMYRKAWEAVNLEKGKIPVPEWLQNMGFRRRIKCLIPALIRNL